jgi:protein SCO1/2
MKRFHTSAVLFVLLGTCAFAQYRSSGYTPSPLPSGAMPSKLDGVGIEEYLSKQIDLDLTFNDEDGQAVNLKDYFNKGRPVLLDLVYYNCPQMCTLILNGQMNVMKQIPWTAGDKYEVVTISIDPRETAEMAREKKATLLSNLGRPAPGWHFLTDRDNNAKKLAEQMGFHYRYDPQLGQYNHVSAIMILTPRGKISRYLYGFTFRPFDVRFALAEASENRTTLTVEKVLLFCFHYDASEGKYVMFATNFMRAGGFLTVLALGWFLFRMVRADRLIRREGLV